MAIQYSPEIRRTVLAARLEFDPFYKDCLKSYLDGLFDEKEFNKLDGIHAQMYIFAHDVIGEKDGAK